MNKERQQGNFSESEITIIAEVLGYWRNKLSGVDLIRPISVQNPYPRFHLTLSTEAGPIKADLHIDARRHRVMEFLPQRYVELQRIVKILEDSPENLSKKIICPLKHCLYFGLSERLASYRDVLDIDLRERYFSEVKSLRAIKSIRKNWVERKYSVFTTLDLG